MKELALTISYGLAALFFSVGTTVLVLNGLEMVFSRQTVQTIFMIFVLGMLAMPAGTLIRYEIKARKKKA